MSEIRDAVQVARMKGQANGQTLVGAVKLAGSDFVTQAPNKVQAIGMIFGKDKSGKTTFVTQHCPAPVVLLNFDNRADHAVAKAVAAGRHVHYGKFARSANIIKMDEAPARREGQAVLDKAVRNLEIAAREAQKGNVRTIGLDTSTELGELLQIAINGRPERATGDFGKSDNTINRQLWHFVNVVRESPAHLIVLSRDKEIYAGRDGTGKFQPRCPKVMTAAVDWIGELRIKRRKVEGEDVARAAFEIEIKDAGANVAELGAVYREEEWRDMGGPFAYLCTLQYPGTDPSDWV